jgi:DNA-directed RNA polymerase subunit RPC12/RpoP
MKLIKLNCAACGAPISMPENLDHLTCSNCGTHLVLERGEGYFALQAADQISDAIHQSGRGTQDAIREGAELTNKELKRLQLTQAYGNAQNALNATMSEQRALTRGQMTPAAVAQMNALNFQEWTQWEDIRRVQMQMDTLDGGPIEQCDFCLQSQIDMLAHSILIMKTCPPSPENQGLIRSLQEERKMYQEMLLDLGSIERRKQIQSFAIEKPFSTDLNELVGQLKQVNADLAFLSRQQPDALTNRLKGELTNLQGELYRHYHDEIYRQCWGELNPNTPPAGDFQTLSSQLEATQATSRWLSAVPAPNRAVTKEIRNLQRSEKRIAKMHGQVGESIRVKDAVKMLRNGLAAFAITAPFSSNLTEVRGQMDTFQQDIRSLKSQPASPEVRQAQQELNNHYRGFYNHWAALERQEVEGMLKSGNILPPFSTDFEQANADYALVTEDVKYLQEHQSIPGVKVLYQQATAKQRDLYGHLMKLKQESSKPPEETK